MSGLSYDLWIALRADTATRNLFNQFYADYPNGAKIDGPEYWMAYPDREPQKYAATRDLLNGITSAFGYTQISFLAALSKAQELRTALAPEMGLTNAFEKLFSTNPSPTIHKIKQALIIKAVLQPNYEKTAFMNSLLPVAYIYEQVQQQQGWWANAYNNGLYYEGFRFFDNIFGTNIPTGTPWTGAFLTDQDRNRLFYIYEISKSEMPLQYKTTADTDKINVWIKNVTRMAIILDTMRSNPAYGPAHFGLPSNFNFSLALQETQLTALYTAAKNFGAKADAIEAAFKSDETLVRDFDLLFDSRWKDKGAYDYYTSTYKPYMIFDFYTSRVIFEKTISMPITVPAFLDAVTKAAAFVRDPLFQPTSVAYYYTTAGILDNMFGLSRQGYHIQWGEVLIRLVTQPGYTPESLRSAIWSTVNLWSELDHTPAEDAFLELFRPANETEKQFALIEAAKMCEGITYYQFATAMKKTNTWIKSVLADPVKLAAFNTQYQTSLSAGVYQAGIPKDLLKKLILSMLN